MFIYKRRKTFPTYARLILLDHIIVDNGNFTLPLPDGLS